MERATKNENRQVSEQEGYQTIDPFDSDDDYELENVGDSSYEDQIIVQSITKQKSGLVDVVMDKEIVVFDESGQSSDDFDTRGRPKSQDPVMTPPDSKKSRHEIRPLFDLRYDGFDHLPLHDENKNASRCKFEGCDGKSRVFCSKCAVHLCLNSRKNCFHAYHVSNTQCKD